MHDGLIFSKLSIRTCSFLHPFSHDHFNKCKVASHCVFFQIITACIYLTLCVCAWGEGTTCQNWVSPPPCGFRGLNSGPELRLSGKHLTLSHWPIIGTLTCILLTANGLEDLFMILLVISVSSRKYRPESFAGF